MSYNYDYNPWDDNPNAGQQQAAGNYATSNASAGGGGGGGYATASGYTNPQYQDAWDDQQQQQQAQYGGQDTTYSYGNEQQQQQQQSVEDEQKPMEDYNEYQHKQASGGESGLVGRFLRAHVPGCGACLDATQPLVDLLFKYVNRDLLVSKIFYFFFYSAFGSLFPLMGVYFKQLGMNPAQVGIITGVRPFIEIFSAPFWNSLADRFQKGKVLLLFSLASWIIFTYSLAHIRPPASACVAFNDTDYVLYTPYSANDLSNYDVGQLESSSSSESSGELTTAGNEVFMNRLPSRELEGKDEILVKEEQVNDQGRRRRKRNIGQLREQIERPRLSYSTNDDDGYQSAAHTDDDPLELDVDLENDFDDSPLGRSAATSAGSAAAAFFDSPGEYQESDEFEQQQQQVRVRRHLSGGGGGGDDEDDDSAAASSEGQENEEGESERVRSSKGRRREDDDEENNIQGGEREEANDEERKQKGAPSIPATPSPPGATQTHESIEGQQQQQLQAANKTKRIYKQRHKTPPTHIVGMSPITVEYAVNYNREKHGQFVTPMFSTIVYKLDDIKEVFFLLLLLITLGEFFSAPALTIADNLTLTFLGTNTDLYGRQRMFGSLGWAITLLLVGMALDNSTTIADHPCGPHQRERSYTVCFTIFSLLMACAFLTATQFTFKYPSSQQASKSGSGGGVVVTKTTDGSGDAVVTTTTDDPYASTRPREIFNTAPPVNAPPPGGSNSASTREKFEFLDKWKSAVFAQSTGQLPEWVNVFRQFKKSMHLTYLFITWFLGCGVGLVFTFLFWHLQDVGGTPTLFGICSVINHISEVLAYFFSSYFIKRYGHTKVLSVGLGCNVIRFLYVAFLSNPYYALPFELVQGITHAACFAACCSYMSRVSKPELKASTQGVMQGLHNGIGRACGALLGGYMINAIGSRASFCIYGLLSGCVLAGLLYIRRKVSLEEEDVRMDDNENLGDFGAPQGVPSTIPGKMV